MKTLFVTHPAYLKHDTGHPHPERPQRLTAIIEKITQSPIRDRLTFVEPSVREDVPHWLERTHTHSHVEFLRTVAPVSGLVRLDADTPMSPGSLDAAELAVAGVLTAVDSVMNGSADNAFCAVRPPGHHAESAVSMGFCLFNNVAVGARYLRERHGLARVLIVDWDVHHGNGTQEIFYRDPSVFYFSSHQSGLYPGTGSELEQGAGEGKNFTLNCPLPAGAKDKDVMKTFEKRLAPAVENFKPDFILISAGFDAHRDDPLGGLELTEAGFGEMSAVVKSLAKTYCGGRIVSCLEGGYHLAALASSVENHLEILSKP